MKVVIALYSGGKLAANTPELLGAAENALGLRSLLEAGGHEIVVLSDKEQQLDREIVTADVLITTPFWPAYVTAARIETATRLKLVLTAGVGSDHIDLAAAAKKGITVAEITGSNVVSVAEHTVMQILALVRNYLPAYQQVRDGRWDIAEAAARSHDLEGMVVGIVGAGRIGQRVALRLRPFKVRTLYYDSHRLSTVEEEVLGAEYAVLDELVRRSDVVTLHCPLTPETDGLFDRARLFRMKKGAYLVNTARGRIVRTEDLVAAMEEQHLAGYAGDVWYPQPAPPDHPWRQMPHHALTVHVSGTTLEAQRRYADGIRDCLVRFFEGKALERDYLIVDGGRIVSPSYSPAYAKK
ncbi:MAG: NAD-dependent formate dehydrogenase [Thermoplasmata archaeon]